MSVDFPHPRYRYYLAELDSDGILRDLLVHHTNSTGTDNRGEAVQRAQHLIINKSPIYRYGLAIVEVLEVITPIVNVTTHIEPPKPPELPEVWDEIPTKTDGEEQ